MDKERKNGRTPGWRFDDMQGLFIPLDKDQPPEIMEKMEAGLEEVNEIVNRLGVRIKVDGGGIIITYSQKQAKQVNSRLAGRPKMKRDVTVGMVREAIESTDSMEEAADQLGISKRTLYRRLREIEEKNLQDDDYI
jgi:transcriptional regulator with PAS, ATPase and Fis domain